MVSMPHGQGMIKLCSLQTVEHAAWAVEAGASHFGMIFAPARRQITLDRAREIDRAIKEAPSEYSCFSGPFSVGVFVNHDVAEVAKIVDDLNLVLVQLHGDEPPSYLNDVGTYVVKAIRPKPDESFDQVAERIDAYARLSYPPVAYLLDGYHPDHAGGEGIRADWTLAGKLAERFPIILAGGLSPENVADAIDAVRPYGVDVSSGVETNGVKDRQKMIDFVANATAAFERFS